MLNNAVKAQVLRLQVQNRNNQINRRVKNNFKFHKQLSNEEQLSLGSKSQTREKMLLHELNLLKKDLLKGKLCSQEK
jgi:hypothetical protein